MTGLVVSDLHLFAGRSDGETLFDRILPRLGTAKILVLNGDTFDFRWSHFSSEEESIEAGLCWLQKLRNLFPTLEIHYVLGNHDCLTRFRERIPSHPKFHLHEDHLRLGSHLFLHGDCSNWGMTPEKLRQYRQAWSQDSPKGTLSRKLYRLVDACGLSRLFHQLYFREAATVARVAGFLNDELENVSKCYFGHSHMPFSSHLHDGVTYFNTGSGIRGMGFNPITFEVD